MIEAARGDIPETAVKSVVGVTLSSNGSEVVVVLELDVTSRGESLVVSRLQRGEEKDWSSSVSTTMSWGRWASLGGSDGLLCVVFAERVSASFREAVISANDERHRVAVGRDGIVFF